MESEHKKIRLSDLNRNNKPIIFNVNNIGAMNEDLMSEE